MKALFVASCVVIAASQIALSRPLHAEEFDKQMADAILVPSADALASLFWSADPGCASLGNTMLKRQCRMVSAERKKAVAGKTFYVEGTAPIRLKSSTKKPATTLSVNSAFATATDDTWIVGKGKVKIDGEVPYTEHTKVSKNFNDKAYATHWTTHVAPRLKTEFLVRIPKRASTFQAKGKNGFQVEVVGYRVYDPCQGEVVAAKPASSFAPSDASACEGEPKYVQKAPKTLEDNGPQKPAQLTRQQIGSTLEAVRDQSKRCHEAYGIDGQASFRMIIGGDGGLKDLKQEGDFVETPTGVCVENAMRAITFPEFADKEMRVSYPIVLR